MLIYHYDPITRALIGSSEPDMDPLEEDRPLVPAFATLTVPPQTHAREVAVLDDDVERWRVLPDWRGVDLYATSDGAQTTITEIGKTPEAAGATELPRPSPAHTWSGTAWVFDADKAREIKAAALSAQIASGYAAAQVQIDYLSRRKRLKRATAAELALLDAWEGYSLDLSDLRADPAWPEVTLPEAPAAAAPVTAGGA